MIAKHSITAVCLMMVAGSIHAGVSPEAAEKLGASLTPMGAERAGNDDGSIPAWEGGLTEGHPDFEPGGSIRTPTPTKSRSSSSMAATTSNTRTSSARARSRC